MKEVNQVVNTPVNKRCHTCNKLLPAAFFYKRAKSKDGLQDSCKECQSTYSKQHNKKKSKRALKQLVKLAKTNSNVSRTTKLKRLSCYHLNYGLQYKILGKLKKGQQREVVCYKCLTCGKEFTTDFDTAWSYRYNCDDCVNKIPGLPTNNLVKPNTFKYDVIRPWPKSSQSNKNTEQIDCDKLETFHEDCKDCHCNEANDCIDCTNELQNDAIIQKLEELREKAQNFKNQNVHVFIIQVPETQIIKHSESKLSFWSKIKKFFHRS